MSTFTNSQLHTELLTTLGLSFQKPGRPRSATHIFTNNGVYKAGSISSDSSVFDITSEHVALILAIQQNDFKVERVVTLTEESTVSPIALKILKDYRARVEYSFSYEVYNCSGTTLLHIENIENSLKEYTSPSQELQYNKEKHYKSKTNKVIAEATIKNLKKYAQKGMGNHFLSSEKGSRYGCAIATQSGFIYFGGAYGNPDKRLGCHAEMATIVSSLMNGAQDITHLAVVSDKYKDTPCPFCGHCRQLLYELFDKMNSNPILISLSDENDKYSQHTLAELLPHQWSSKKW